MAVLTKDKTRYVQKPEFIRVRNMNVAAATTIFNGSIVAADAAGDAVTAPAGQNAEFMGVARDGLANAGAATTDTPLVVETGQLERFTIAAATQADLGKKVYYSNDGTVVLAAPADLTTQVGTIVMVKSATVVLVDTSKSIT